MKARVYQNKFGFNILCKNKMLNGEELKYYMPVQFRKGTEPLGEKLDIEIIDGWFTCYNNRDGETRPKFFVNNYTQCVDEAGFDHGKPIKAKDLFKTEPTDDIFSNNDEFY